ncbi:nitric oxide dioxygenase [Epilithonimonas hungarica]|uniref:NO-inducible flavohemoprotein n=1 Tax=Epilithonimonas hungarica TaxID=454006 RepID=UPI0027889224|nr:NO-inducible flavohemoprotein [Epilithonimonas hungarica]MDP9955213.1 nitric oxide dioxygenase [Epilithonimonas hungarica]
MTSKQKRSIKDTIPTLKTNGIDLTKHFYKRMFFHNPELKNVFNMGNQANGKQQNALAGAVLAYAEHIENPGILIGTLETIGNKHVSLNITPEQYDIVGTHLLASIKEVLADKATDDIIEAWTQAYNELAAIMISIEEKLYQNNLTKKGGWKGWRAFTISSIVDESKEIKSFYLEPKDKKDIPPYFPGQYITVKIFVPSLGYEQPRQYSLSSVFIPNYYRISVKKEIGMDRIPDGMVSNHIHEKVIGDEIWVSSPSGTFYADIVSDDPLVLISGGVGVTPMMSILEAYSNSGMGNNVVWVHGCKNEESHTFKSEVELLQQNNDWLSSFVFYEETEIENEVVRKGRIDLSALEAKIIINGAKYYICGPEPFIKAHYNSLITLGVSRDSIFYEEFGPQLLQIN